MLDKLPHDVLVDFARSFGVVDRVVFSEVCRACRDATREALAFEERCRVPVKAPKRSPISFAPLEAEPELSRPGDKEFLSLASSSRLAWAQEHGFRLRIGRKLLMHAAQVGSLEVMEELAKGVSKDDLRFALLGAAMGGKLDILKWLWSQPESWNIENVTQVWWHAAKHGHVHILEFLGGDEEVAGMSELQVQDCLQATDLMMPAIEGGHIDLFKWIHDRVDPVEWHEELEQWIPILLDQAVQVGHLEIARFILGTYEPVAQERGLSLLTPGLTRLAGENCDYDMLRWLVEEGCPIQTDPDCLERFATSGKYGAVDVERLKWAHEQGLQLSEAVAEAAIARNDLASARWLRENGCQGFTFDSAVYLALRHTRYPDDMLLFLVEECGAWFDSNEIKCSDATQHSIQRTQDPDGRKSTVEMIEYLRRRGCEWGRVMIDAASQDNLELMRWLHENGCPGLESDDYFYDEVLYEASLCGTAQLHLWMLSVMGPQEREELWVKTCSNDEAENGPQSVAEWEEHLRREEEELIG